VRLHTDAQAARSAREVQAIAYTVGPNIVFGAGRYAPHTESGRRTLAHELSHVVQQAGAARPGRLRIGPADDALEQEAERMAAGVVDHAAEGSLQARARAGVQMLRRQTDAAVESGTGVDTGIADGTMNPVGGVDGVTFDASDCFGVDECDVHFKFEKAYVGTYPYRAAPGRTVRGAYVKIVMSAEPGCGDCPTLEAVQILRNTRRNRSGDLVTADPGTAVRRRRSGWGNRSAPSRGWRIDALESERDPFYTHGGWVGMPGTGGSPATIWDTPGDWDTDRNAGKDFQTCLICVAADGARSTLGCVNWGYYTDSSRNVSFLPAMPVASCGGSRELGDAARRWEGIRGNQPLYLQGHVPPRAPGDFPTPRGDTRFA
jgi:hypothetical protein